MAGKQPQLKLTFIGDGFRGGAVPLTVVASKLQALQQAMFHAAAAVAGHQEERRGLWYNRYRGVAELSFASSHHSDLEIVADLIADPVLHENFDTGQQAVDLLFDVALAVESDARPQLRITRLNHEYLLRAIEGLMPNSGDQYSVRLENCRPDKHPPVTFSPESRRRAKGRIPSISQIDAFDEASIVGELIKIHIDAGEDKITVRSQRRDIDCFYGDALRDKVANLVGGSTVEVTGLANVSDFGSVVKIHQMIDVEPVSMEPLRIGKFEFDGRVYHLNTPIAVNVEYSEGLWVYNYPPLNLWGYAARREDALKDLQCNFAYLYREFVEDQSSELDKVAERLRDSLIQLVTTQTAGDAANA